jgi:transcription-repair coupling factor (superfamily II helicase)
MYKRLAGVETEAQWNDVRAEMQDRYGELPAAVNDLMEYAALKLLCAQIGIISIDRKRDVLNIKFKQNANIDPGKLAQFVASQRGSQFSPDGTLKFVCKSTASAQVLAQLRNLLEELSPEKVAPVAT